MSLYIQSQAGAARSKPNQPIAVTRLRPRRRQHNNRTHETTSLSAATATSADDDLQTAHSSYNSRYSRPATISIELNASPNEDYDVTDEEELPGFRNLNKTTLVELVTTGSKIVFIEDDSVDEAQDKSAQDNNVNLPSDEIKVTSISISSSSKQNRQHVATFAGLDDAELHTSGGRHSSNLARSRFSVEENDEVIIEQSTDSIRAESEKFERIAPMDSRHHTKPSSARALNPIDALSADALSPIEGLIIHDQNFHKLGGARPRSVSYSSLSQTINQGTNWRGGIRHNRTQYDQLENHQPYQINYSKPELNYSEPSKVYSETSKVYGEPSKVYSEPSKVYSEPAKVYSEPEKIYSEPAKIYSEPSRIYSEPSKVYSKPSKVYSEPSRVYGEPSKVYSHSGNAIKPIQLSTSTRTPSTPSTITTSTTKAPLHTASVLYSEHHVSPVKKVIFNLDKLPYDLLNAPVADDEINNKNYLYAPHLDAQRFHHFNRMSQDQQFQSKHQLPPSSLRHRTTSDPRVETTTRHGLDWTPEPNYAENPPSPTSVAYSPSITSPPSEGVPQDTDSSENVSVDDDEADPKVGFVVEGRNYRKYRVEEKTPDGFIVGEYGVVSTNDGSLRGVRYTADSNISPNLIYEALMKFLAL